MKYNFGKIKRKIAFLLIFLMSINSFAAIVSDNDGSAFVTKQEFDALKANFNKQIDDYNASIDGKIDGAIASYLSGISLVKTRNEKPLVGDVGSKLVFFTPNDDLEYGFAPLQISGNATRLSTQGQNFSSGQWATSMAKKTWEGYSVIEAHFNPNNSLSDRFQKKTAISDLDESLQIAKWDGFYETCQDKVVFNGWLDDTALHTIADPDFGTFLVKGLHIVQCNKFTNVDLEGQLLLCLSGFNAPVLTNSVYTYLYGYSIDASFAGKSDNVYAALFNYDYDMFSNTKRNYNWGYGGTYQTEFDGYPTYADFPAATTSDVFSDIMNYATGGKGRYVMFKFTDTALNVNGNVATAPEATYTKQGFDITEADIDGGKFFTVGSGRETNIYVPMIGFETTYLTNWGQIYNTEYDQYITAGATSVVTDASSVKHMRMTNGVPFVQLKKEESFTYTFDFEDKTKNYWIWMKDSPFLSETNILPATNETTLDLEGCGAKINGAYKLINGSGQVRYTNNTESEQIIYLKFASGGAAAPSSYDTIDGGTLILNDVFVHKPD